MVIRKAFVPSKARLGIINFSIFPWLSDSVELELRHEIDFPYNSLPTFSFSLSISEFFGHRKTFLKIFVSQTLSICCQTIFWQCLNVKNQYVECLKIVFI